MCQQRRSLRSGNPVPKSIHQQEAGNSGGVGGIATNLVGLQQGDWLRGTRETPGAVVATNSGQEAYECYVKRYFGGGKGEALEIRQAWRGGGDRGVAESEANAGKDGSSDAGTEKGYLQVVELSCVATCLMEQERELGWVGSPSPVPENMWRTEKVGAG